MKNTKKLFFLTLLLVCMTFILAGCGATISTKMIVNKDFSGQRVIDVKIDSEDLSDNVTGGIDALKSVADTNLPAEMTVSVTSDDSSSTLVFTIDFKDLEDYRDKVEKIIAKGSDTELVPEIFYENQNTVFKKGVWFEENFTSFDLIRWYFDALQTAGIITHEDTSDWYEMGDNFFSVDEVEYDTGYGDEYSVEEQELTCLDSVEVETVLNIDGTFKRIFTFGAGEDTIEDLAEKSCDLNAYLKKLTPENDSFELVEDGSYKKFIITVTAEDEKQLVEKTNAILQSENAFSVAITLDEEKQGMAKVSVKEKLDGSYYLDYEYRNPLSSTIRVFDNTTLAGNSGNASFSDGALMYRPGAANETEFTFDWQISFASVEIIFNVKNEENATVDLVFTAEEKLADDIKASAIKALEDRCGENAEHKKDGDVLTVTFSGSVAEICSKINAFIKTNPEADVEGADYFVFTFTEAETASKFTRSFSGSVTYDLSPIIGNARVLFNDTESFLEDYYYQGDFATDDNGDRTASSSATVTFTLVKVSVVSIVLTAVFALLFLVGVILLIVKRKAIGEWIKEAKQKKQEKAQAAQAPSASLPETNAAPLVAQPAVQENATQPAEAAPKPAEAESEEETEELL